MNELSDSQLTELCKALGWQGGTYHQVLSEVQAQKNKILVQAAKLETARLELARVNNEFGSETADWPEAWKRVAEVKERAGRLWRQNEMLRATMAVIVRDWTEQFEKNGSLAPHWVREAREALKS